MSLLMDAIKKAEDAKESKDLPSLSFSQPEVARAVPDTAANFNEEAKEEKPLIDEREQAGNLFAAKMLHDKNDRYLAVAAAGAVLAIVGLIYFWQASKSEPPIETPAPRPELNPASAPIAILTPAPPPSATGRLPKPVAPPETKEAPKPETPKPEPARKEERPIKVETNPSRPVLNPLSAAAYQAMMKKNLSGAKKDYAKLLSQDRNNKDALLGLAAISAHEGKNDEAMHYYKRVLELDPENPTATAALVGLNGQTAPAMGESTLKTMIKNQPDSSALYFSLGNLYASESRWGEAQEAYFNAFTKESDNADFAFNLAVSLDHLNQTKLALHYYSQALKLSAKGVPGFDPVEAQKRIHELE